MNPIILRKVKECEQKCKSILKLLSSMKYNKRDISRRKEKDKWKRTDACLKASFALEEPDFT